MPIGANDPDSAYPASTASGGDVGLPCWFRSPSTFTADSAVTLNWVANADGVSEFIDARVKDDDDEVIEIVTPGTYRLDVEAMCMTEPSADPTDVNMTLMLNDDEVGPLYELTARVHMLSGTYATLRTGCPVTFAAGDVIKVVVNSSPADVRPMICNFMLLRLASA